MDSSTIGILKRFSIVFTSQKEGDFPCRIQRRKNGCPKHGDQNADGESGFRFGCYDL